ncbi:hypothetical protein F5Y16DRAFT_294540 [Xylariaceae sp. FL0255]|nr:hypothetical protein F5Y16DRAFT_294540 [Xylariaceae sp. FL0255]
MFGPGSISTTNFKGLRRKVTNDGNSTTSHMTRPSTASASLHYNETNMSDLLGPSLDGPPSPEGIRALNRQMKQGSVGELQRSELMMTSSRSSSAHSSSVAPDTPQWDRSLDNLGISRNPSQRSSIFKDRPESIQLLSKTMFTLKGKLQRENSEQSLSSASMSSSTELPIDVAPQLPKDQRFMQAVFSRRRTRGQSDVPKPKPQISGPYNFQHVSHTGKQNLPNLDEVNRRQTIYDGPPSRQRRDTLVETETGVDQSAPSSLQQSLDKPLPTPPTPTEELQRTLSRDGLQMSPRHYSKPQADGGFQSPIPPPPRTSSRISVRHDRHDSIDERPNTSSSLHKVNSLTSALSDVPKIASAAHLMPGQLDEQLDISQELITPMEDSAWPLNNTSMSSLAEVPEEDEYFVHSRNSFANKRTSLRASVSVPYLRQVSLSQAKGRSPSNASETLGRMDLFAIQRALRESSDSEYSDNDEVVDNWEDDIDYCYDHAAEADCDFAWERPSLDEGEREESNAQDSRITHFRFESTDSFEFLSPGLMMANDAPGLSLASYESTATTPHEAATSTSAPLVTSNFSLPRIDSSTKLKRDHASQSSISSYTESQGFSLSPSLLIPNDYHEKMLQFERGESSFGDDNGFSLEDPCSKFGKPATLLPARSSASTSISTSSEQSTASSYEKSSASSVYTRWTGSSNSSWQGQFTESHQPPISITLNDKEPVITPTSDVTPRSEEPPRLASQPESVREAHNRTQSDATLLMKSPAMDTITPLDLNIAKDPLKTHRRARTSSRSHANGSPQFALFPQIPRRV